MKLKDKVAIVTGSSRGIGKAIALAFAREGAKVVVAARTDKPTEGAPGTIHTTAEEIRALGGQALPVKCDVANMQSVNEMFQKTMDEFGQVDILVNNAGGSARERSSSFHESTEEVWDQVVGVNLKGTRNCTRAVINHMMERRSGNIINISSGAGMLGFVGSGDYAAAKAGIICFTMVIAKGYGSYGINVNCVSPGPIETEWQAMMRPAGPGPGPSPGPGKFGPGTEEDIPLGRRGKPEEIASMVVFLASDEASYITGQNISVCGGRNMGL